MMQLIVTSKGKYRSSDKILLEKLTVTQLVKKSPAFYGIQSFITFATDPYREPDESN
jgi:hypothetical protein